MQMSQFYCDCNSSIQQSYHYISNTFTECRQCPNQSYVIENLYTKQQTCKCNYNQKYYQNYNKCDIQCDQIYSYDQTCINCSTYKINSTHCYCNNGYYDIILQQCIQCQQILNNGTLTCDCGLYYEFNPYTQKCQELCNNQVQTINGTCIDCPNDQLLYDSVLREKWQYFCQCENFKTIYNQYNNNCYDCTEQNLKSLITTCQCGNNYIFNKSLQQCQQTCKPNQIRRERCINCPQNVLSIDYYTCDCQQIDSTYQFIQQYNICTTCPQYSTYIADNFTCQCPDQSQLLQNNQTNKLYCDIDCNTENIDQLKELYSQGYCQCDNRQYYNQTEMLCIDCSANSIQADNNNSCNCSQQDKIWNYNNQCVQCPEGTTQDIIQQTCICQYQNINETYNYNYNRCDIKCDITLKILNPLTKLCESCPQNSTIDIQQNTCICDEINEQKYMYDQYTGNNKCILCKNGLNETNNQCLCEWDQFIYNIYQNNCILQCNYDYNQFISSYTKKCETCPGIIDENNLYICNCVNYDYLNIIDLLCQNCTANSTYNNQLETCQCNTYFIQENDLCILNCSENTIIYKQDYCYQCTYPALAIDNQCVCQTQQNFDYSLQKCITCPKNSYFDNDQKQCICFKDKNLYLSENGDKCIFECKDNEIKIEYNYTCHYCGEQIEIKRKQCWCKSGYLYYYDGQICIKQTKQMIIVGSITAFTILLSVILSCCTYSCCKEDQKKIKDINNQQTFKQKYENWVMDNKQKKLNKKQQRLLKRQQIQQEMKNTIQSNQIARPKKQNKHKKHKKHSQ